MKKKTYWRNCDKVEDRMYLVAIGSNYGDLENHNYSCCVGFDPVVQLGA